MTTPACRGTAPRSAAPPPRRALLARARRARRGRRRSGPVGAGRADRRAGRVQPRRWPLLALVGRWVPQYLPWATVGLVGGATITALASLPDDYPTALYAAAAALLGVVAELLRGAIPAPGSPSPRTGTGPNGGCGAPTLDVDPPERAARPLAGRPGHRRGDRRDRCRPCCALISIAPALAAALFDPFQQLSAIWNGPIAALTNPSPGNVDGTSVLAAVLLTVAAALAATGFGGKPAEAVPVILPGLAITLLITPIALDAAWPGVDVGRAGGVHHRDARAGAHPTAGRDPRARCCASPATWSSSSGCWPAAPGWPAAWPPSSSPCSRWAARSASALVAAIVGRSSARPDPGLAVRRGDGASSSC